MYNLKNMFCIVVCTLNITRNTWKCCLEGDVTKLHAHFYFFRVHHAFLIRSMVILFTYLTIKATEVQKVKFLCIFICKLQSHFPPLPRPPPQPPAVPAVLADEGGK